jgi:hypothetical protein
MGLDISIVKGTVHPEYLQKMVEGETIGCGLRYGGVEIVESWGCVYDARKQYRVRDALVAALQSRAESEYHLLTQQRCIDIRDTSKRYADMLVGNPEDVYYDELDSLRKLSATMDLILKDDDDEAVFFAIWG